jgi:hypothetical protein
MFGGIWVKILFLGYFEEDEVLRFMIFRVDRGEKKNGLESWMILKARIEFHCAPASAYSKPSQVHNSPLK